LWLRLSPRLASPQRPTHALAGDDIGGIIYRTGSRTDNALTDASGVSFRDSVSSSLSSEHPQVFRPGDKIWGLDTSKLPAGSVVRDGVPPGHVSVYATPEQIRAAIVQDPLLSFGWALASVDVATSVPKSCGNITYAVNSQPTLSAGRRVFASPWGPPTRLTAPSVGASASAWGFGVAAEELPDDALWCAAGRTPLSTSRTPAE
jgi:hypothetical protein